VPRYCFLPRSTIFHNIVQKVAFRNNLNCVFKEIFWRTQAFANFCLLCIDLGKLNLQEKFWEMFFFQTTMHGGSKWRYSGHIVAVIMFVCLEYWFCVDWDWNIGDQFLKTKFWKQINGSWFQYGVHRNIEVFDKNPNFEQIFVANIFSINFLQTLFRRKKNRTHLGGA
jgi:hypothetical protein